MRPFRTIHQIMPAFLYADALGQQAYRIREQLRRWGYESQVYTAVRDQRWTDPGLEYARYRSQPNQALIYHYSIGSPVTEFVRRLHDVVVPYYHNITPPEFFQGYNPELAVLLEQGRRELPGFRGVPYAWAASEYNRLELLALGFQRVDVLPYFVYLDELRASAESPAGQRIADRYADGVVNLLFVGRLAPNKRQDDLIRALNYYSKVVNSHARLILVGSDANAPGYKLELQTLASILDLPQVELTGPIGFREGLGGCYRAATIFLCLSEHEGFCVPLLEAMAFDVPVVAFKATGVPYALGEAGILLNEKRYDVLGELIDIVASDQSLRARLLATQRRRLSNYAPTAITEQLRKCIEAIATC
jgi:glycosyltransferase involved in cell wall biosynthesis